jgi:poly(A) polymerase
MKKLLTFLIIFALFAAICTMSSAHAGGWKKSYHAGTFDKNLNYMGGTEIMSLASHKGKLYAATSLWMNSVPLPDSIGAQILVKESPGKKWKLDYQTDKQILRVDSLVSITLGTDGQGNKLSEPVNLLVAGLWDIGYPLPAAATVAVRDDATNKWITTDLLKYPAGNYMPTIRAIGTHKDRITGVDHVFVAILGIIYSGVYDSTAPGQIRWESKPEFINVDDRLMAFGECNGELYAAIKPAIYKRIDGPTPTWEKVYEYTTFAGDKPSYLGGSSGMRGLTAIPNPQGDGEVLLMALEGFDDIAKIVYLDPSDNNSVTTDFDLGAFLKEQLKDIWSAQRYYVVTAYNDMERVTDPKTGEDLLLIGLGVFNDVYNPDNSWYLVRHPDATYAMHEIPCIFDLHGQPKTLSGNRTIRVSPFAKDNGQVLYFGGFDCLGKTSHNTAWIYSVDIDTALGH